MFSFLELIETSGVVTSLKIFPRFFPMGSPLCDPTKRDYKILGKICSNLLVIADVYFVKTRIRRGLAIGRSFELFARLDSAKSDKGSESFSCTITFNDNRGHNLNGLRQQSSIRGPILSVQLLSS